MKLACPSCQHAVTAVEIDHQMTCEIVCEHCQASIGVTVTTSLLQAGTPSGALSTTHTALVAIADEGLRTTYAQALERMDWTVRQASGGREALKSMGVQVPDVAIIDGGFEAIFGMGVGEIIKRSAVTRHAQVLGLRGHDNSGLPVPGADLTVDLHAGPDEIITAARKLARNGQSDQDTESTDSAAPLEQKTSVEPVVELAAPPAVTPVAAEHTASETAPVAEQKPAEDAAPEGDDKAHAAAKRLARIIVSDIALYNSGAIDEGARSGHLRQAMTPFLAEGHDHYCSRVSDAIRDNERYFEEAVDTFIAQREEAAQSTAA